MRVAELLSGGEGGGSRHADLGLLAIRIFVGLTLAFAHGMNKLPPVDRFVDVVGAMGFPAPALFAWAASISESFGALFLALGLLTRPAALMILITMLVAAFGRHASDPFTDKELALLYGALSAVFLVMGSGRFGVDAWLRRRFR
jgi:putative oxidoreductase